MKQARGSVTCTEANSTSGGCVGCYTNDIAIKIRELLFMLTEPKVSSNFKATIEVTPDLCEHNLLEIVVRTEGQ